MHEARAYSTPGTPEEQSRRTFLANATLAVGGVIGLVLAVPLVTSLVPESMLDPDRATGASWGDLPKDALSELDLKSGTPVQFDFSFIYRDGYFAPAEERQTVWGIKLSPEQERTFKASRADLFATPGATLPYEVASMGFVLFSSVCPHLGCPYEWHADKNRFICPCHGSQFSSVGEKLKGPASRGLDPLPLREHNGTAQVTWIRYKASTPDRVIVGYS